MRKIAGWIGILGAATVLTAGPLTAQERLDAALLGRCQMAALDGGAGLLCENAVASIQLLQPELGLLLAGGNPVLGTASPVGTKFRWMPRFQFGGRISFAWAEIPDIRVAPGEAAGAGTRSFAMAMPQLDLSVGVFDGLRIGKTLGGFGAVEVVGSLSTLILPDGEGFEEAATGLGLGARIGLLRESFTAPGLSVTGMYKRFGHVEYGRERSGETNFGLDMETASFRFGLSKSFVSFGLGLTLAYDSYWSDVDLAVARAGLVGLDAPVVVIPEAEPLELQTERWSAFLDVSYIVLFFSVTAELGWQEEAGLATSNGHDLEAGNLFTTIGVRLSI